MRRVRGFIINILSFNHPHAESLFVEGLWGFPEDRIGRNRRNWSKISLGDEALIYGEYRGVKGIWFHCRIVDKFESREPVRYWVRDPTGYPYQIRLEPIFPVNRFKRDALDRIEPVRKDELASLGIGYFRQRADRWSLIVFSENERYDYSIFSQILELFRNRNESLELERPNHENLKRIIYQIGDLQNRFPATEFPLENRRIDVVWRRTSRSVPYVAFEIQLGGNIFEALTKLKHAYDIWNAIPVLITTEDQVAEARRWIEGSFHEIKDVFRILTWRKIVEFYRAKRKVREFERMIGLL